MELLRNLLLWTCTAHSNPGFIISISETKCALISLETSCKKSGISKMECTTEFQVQQLPQILVRTPSHGSTLSSTEDLTVLHNLHLNCVNEHVAQK